MGLDYIRARTGKPWRKRWDRGLDRLKAPTLLDLKMSEASRVATVQLNSDTCGKTGDTLIVQITAGGMLVSDGLRAIGQIPDSSPEMTAEIRDCGGYAEAVVQRVGMFGDTLEVVVK